MGLRKNKKTATFDKKSEGNLWNIWAEMSTEKLKLTHEYSCLQKSNVEEDEQRFHACKFNTKHSCMCVKKMYVKFLIKKGYNKGFLYICCYSLLGVVSSHIRKFYENLNGTQKNRE